MKSSSYIPKCYKKIQYQFNIGPNIGSLPLNGLMIYYNNDIPPIHIHGLQKPPSGRPMVTPTIPAVMYYLSFEWPTNFERDQQYMRVQKALSSHACSDGNRHLYLISLLVVLYEKAYTSEELLDSTRDIFIGRPYVIT